MSFADELRRRAEELRTSDLIWVAHEPDEPGTECAVVRHPMEKEKTWKTSMLITSTNSRFVSEYMISHYPNAKVGALGMPICSISGYNDWIAESKEDVIMLLEKMAIAADEQEI
jgi:hypothetical protein